MIQKFSRGDTCPGCPGGSSAYEVMKGHNIRKIVEEYQDECMMGTTVKHCGGKCDYLGMHCYNNNYEVGV